MNNTLGNIFKGDKVVWMVFFFLCVISVVEVFSSSSSLTYKSGTYWEPVIKHSAILVAGLFFTVITLNIKCKYFKVLTPFLIILSYIFLLWVLFAGTATNDASRWVNFIGIQFQPSEIAKGTMVLVTAQILSGTQTPQGADRHAFWWIGMACMPMIMLIAVENLSTAMLISITIFMMMFVGRVPIKQLGGLMGLVVILITFVVALILLIGKAEEPKAPTDQEIAAQTDSRYDAADNIRTVTMEDATAAKKKNDGVLHRLDTWKMRIIKFVDRKPIPPEDVDLDRDAQVAHSNIAIASSGVVGRGPGNSVERDFLSQAFSDFIYAIIIEELGVVGAFFVAFLYVVLLFRAGRIATRCENNFPAFLAMGIALMLVTQALFNMCVAVGLVPVTGQPLPLISKGGTSTIINCIYIGVILSISRSAKKRQTANG